MYNVSYRAGKKIIGLNLSTSFYEYIPIKLIGQLYKDIMLIEIPFELKLFPLHRTAKKHEQSR